MTKAKFNSELKAFLDDLLLALPDVSAGVVFGLPCYRVSAGVFATLYGDGVGVKLPAARVRELMDKPGFVPFQPFGRNRGKEFVQIQHDDMEDYRHDLALFEESIRYLLSSHSDQKAVAAQQPEAGDTEHHFRTISERLAHENSAISLGRMMSSPAIQYQGKVFAFYYAGKMVFKLGRDFQPELLEIHQYSVLAPFKTKPPMVDWFEIPATEKARWEELARHALQRISAD